jgi:hypothetical protein
MRMIAIFGAAEKSRAGSASSHLLGFHATRLMDHEVEEIKRRGLQRGPVDDRAGGTASCQA